MAHAKTALTAPWRRLQAKADKSHGQDANRALESILEGSFDRELTESVTWTLFEPSDRSTGGGAVPGISCYLDKHRLFAITLAIEYV